MKIITVWTEFEDAGTGQCYMAQTLPQLHEAEGLVALGIRRVATQQQLVDNLKRGQHDTSEARRLLDELQDLLAVHIADRDRRDVDKALRAIRLPPDARSRAMPSVQCNKKNAASGSIDVDEGAAIDRQRDAGNEIRLIGR